MNADSFVITGSHLVPASIGYIQCQLTHVQIGTQPWRKMR